MSWPYLRGKRISSVSITVGETFAWVLNAFRRLLSDSSPAKFAAYEMALAWLNAGPYTQAQIIWQLREDLKQMR